MTKRAKNSNQELLNPIRDKLTKLTSRTDYLLAIKGYNDGMFSSGVISDTNMIRSGKVLNTIRICTGHMEWVQMTALWDHQSEDFGIISIINDLRQSKKSTDIKKEIKDVILAYYGEANLYRLEECIQYIHYFWNGYPVQVHMRGELVTLRENLFDDMKKIRHHMVHAKSLEYINSNREDAEKLILFTQIIIEMLCTIVGQAYTHDRVENNAKNNSFEFWGKWQEQFPSSNA